MYKICSEFFLQTTLPGKDQAKNNIIDEVYTKIYPKEVDSFRYFLMTI